MKAFFGKRKVKGFTAGLKAPVLYIRKSRVNPEAVVVSARRRNVSYNETSTIERYTLAVFNGKKSGVTLYMNNIRDLFGDVRIR